MPQQFIHVPLGYALTLTTDAFTSGSYVRLANPGSSTRYSPTFIDADVTVTIGPFNEERDYRIESEPEELDLSLAFSSSFTPDDNAEVKDYIESVGLNLDAEQVYQIDGEDVAPAANMVAKNSTDASEFDFVVDEDTMTSDADDKVPTQQSVKAYVDTADALKADDSNTVHIDDTDASGYSWVVDEDNMTSDSATEVPTQQSVKAYVDTSIADMVTTNDDVTALTPLGETNVQTIANDANGTAIATAVNGILAILIAAGLMDAPA